MKANELMLGDIITFKDSVQADEIPIPVKVVALGYQHHGEENEALVRIGDDDTCDIVTIDEEFVGYPLTAEILEKNGFRHGCYVGGYYSPDCPFRVFTKTEGTCGFTTLFDDEIHFSCIFVHQLQQALHLCGIEHEITL